MADEKMTGLHWVRRYEAYGFVPFVALVASYDDTLSPLGERIFVPRTMKA
jgi:hypothetical protein